MRASARWRRNEWRIAEPDAFTKSALRVPCEKLILSAAPNHRNPAADASAPMNARKPVRVTDSKRPETVAAKVASRHRSSTAPAGLEELKIGSTAWFV